MYTYRYQHGDRPLDGYTIQRAAGRGGFGEVYYALSDSGREVALKAVQGYEDIELRGISQCMNLKSPHLVTIFDVRHNTDGAPFVIMEFVNGPSLRQLLDESPAGLGEQKSAFFLREIAKGLTFLHDCGIVHRDLKPANIFYENGYVKIGDYGLSKAISSSQHSNQTVTVGTLHYMAPEIGAGKYDRSIDIYALGACLYELLTGTVPFIGASPTEILMKHLAAEPDVIGIPEPFASVIKRAMAKDPALRYQSVQEMVEAVFGAEHIRQSVSVFSPDALSMVAARAAVKMPVGVVAGAGVGVAVGSSAVSADRSREGFQGIGDRIRERMQRNADRVRGRIESRSDQFRQRLQNFADGTPALLPWNAAGSPVAGPSPDPWAASQRIYVAWIVTVLAALATPALTGGAWGSAALTFATIWVGVSLVRVIGQSNPFSGHDTASIVLVTFLGAASVALFTFLYAVMPAQTNYGIEAWTSSGFWRDAPVVWIAAAVPFFFWKGLRMETGRKSRLIIGQIAMAGGFAFAAGSVFGAAHVNAQAALCAAAIAMASQLLSPWYPLIPAATSGVPAGASPTKVPFVAAETPPPIPSPPAEEPRPSAQSAPSMLHDVRTQSNSLLPAFGFMLLALVAFGLLYTLVSNLATGHRSNEMFISPRVCLMLLLFGVGGATSIYRRRRSNWNPPGLAIAALVIAGVMIAAFWFM